MRLTKLLNGNQSTWQSKMDQRLFFILFLGNSCHILQWQGCWASLIPFPIKLQLKHKNRDALTLAPTRVVPQHPRNPRGADTTYYAWIITVQSQYIILYTTTKAQGPGSAYLTTLQWTTSTNRKETNKPTKLILPYVMPH